jgi:hypothetical protein
MGLSFNGVHPDRFGPTAHAFHDAITSLPPGGSLEIIVLLGGIR